jgi:hypothetical protein
MYRSLFGLGLVGVMIVACFSEPVRPTLHQAQTKNEQSLIVKIVPIKTVVFSGENVDLRVEVWNEGSDEVFIGKNLGYPSDSTGGVELFVEHNSRLDRSMNKSAGDYIVDLKTPFASLVTSHFIALAPGHFYGQVVSMDPGDFPRIKIPGRYLIKGEYIAGGFYGGGEGNPLQGHEAEIKTLPYKAWEGRVDTNSVWMEVRAKK